MAYVLGDGWHMLSKFIYYIAHWEVWHWFAKYIIIGPAWLWYCLKARSFWFFTPANPTITFGGFVGESRWLFKTIAARNLSGYCARRTQMFDRTDRSTHGGTRFVSPCGKARRGADGLYVQED